MSKLSIKNSDNLYYDISFAILKPFIEHQPIMTNHLHLLELYPFLYLSQEVEDRYAFGKDLFRISWTSNSIIYYLNIVNDILSAVPVDQCNILIENLLANLSSDIVEDYSNITSFLLKMSYDHKFNGFYEIIIAISERIINNSYKIVLSSLH